MKLGAVVRPNSAAPDMLVAGREARSVVLSWQQIASELCNSTRSLFNAVRLQP
jgi:hypothetical protein